MSGGLNINLPMGLGLHAVVDWSSSGDPAVQPLVGGIYTSDPMQDADATFLKRVTYLDVLNRGLKVMDTTAVSLCMDNSLPIVVFNLKKAFL